jgi:hypothetical protein
MAPNQLPAGSHRRRQGTGRSERQRVGLDGSRDGPAARNQAHDSAGSRRDPAQRQGCPRSQGCGSPLPRIVPTGVPFGTGPKRTDRIRPSRASGSRSGGARSTGRRRRERITSPPAPARRGCRRSPCRCVGDHPLWRSPPFGSLRSVPLQRTEQVPAVGGNASDHSLGLKLRYRKPVRTCTICHLPASRRRNSSHAHRRIGPRHGEVGCGGDDVPSPPPPHQGRAASGRCGKVGRPPTWGVNAPDGATAIACPRCPLHPRRIPAHAARPAPGRGSSCVARWQSGNLRA